MGESQGRLEAQHRTRFDMLCSSRMAAYITLDKTLTDLVVAQAPNLPWA
jgi:hypothetical protein